MFALVPSDLLVSFLSNLPDELTLVACTLTCSRFRRALATTSKMLRSSSKNIPNPIKRHQNSILEELAIFGTRAQYEWLLRDLCYPPLDKLSQHARNLFSLRAAYWGNDAMLRLVCENHFSPAHRGELVCAAAQGGHSHLVSWLRLPDYSSGQARWHEQACIGAARAGRLEALRELADPSHLLPASALREAARAGQVAVLQWAHECKYDSLLPAELSLAAAERGHVHILRWLLEHGYYLSRPETQALCIRAARNGHLSVLQLAAHTWPATDFDSCLTAACSGESWIVLDWLIVERGCRLPVPTVLPATYEATVQLLGTEEAFGLLVIAASAGMTEYLSVAKEAGAYMPWQLLESIAHVAHQPKTLAWIEENAPPPLEPDFDTT